jgi:hypothetical protein
MPKTEFFSTELISNTISDVTSRDSDLSDSREVNDLRDILDFIVANGTAVDENSQFSIPLISRTFLNLLRDFRAPYSTENVDQLSAIVFRVLTEYNLSIAGEAPRQIQDFIDSVENRMDSLPSSVRSSIEYSQRSLPIRLLKQMLATEEISAVRDVGAFSQSVRSNITNWQAKLDEQQGAATQLGAIFERHAGSLNFGNLHEGFSDMLKDVNIELRQAQKGIWFFGFLLLLPALFEIIFVASHISAGISPPIQLLGITAVGTVTLTLILLYFFRIALRKADSCRAQLMQINLRRSLCRFIQPYTDYSKDVREKHNETFAKFESLIFSGLVGTTDKLPSSFDGLEQISGLVKALKGDK